MSKTIPLKNVEFWSPYKFTFLSEVSFEHSDRIVKGEPHGDRKKRKEVADKIAERFEASAINLFESRPIGTKEDDRTDAEKDQDLDKQSLHSGRVNE